MSSITKSIQNEYVLLMENAFSEKYKYAFRNLELKELRRFILKELISSPELDNQLTNLIVLLNKFWDTHAAALITEVRASKSYRLLLPIQRFGYNISNHLRSLGIYFDSIIMVDPLHFPSISSLHSFLSLPPDNSYVRMRRLVLLEHSTKTNRPGDTVTHVQVMPGATLKYELITDELCLTAASVGGECECKTLADSE